MNESTKEHISTNTIEGNSMKKLNVAKAWHPFNQSVMSIVITNKLLSVKKNVPGFVPHNYDCDLTSIIMNNS